MLGSREDLLEFKRGVTASIGISIGYIPIAITFGFLAKSTGLTFTDSVAMSLLVFAGAAQYITLSLLAIGTGFLEIIITVFMVNIRHVLLSMTLNEQAREESRLKKATYAFGVTDEVFAVATSRQGQIGFAYMLGLSSVAYSAYVGSTALGYMLGAFLPATLQIGMGIAIYAMFIGLLVPSVKKSKKALFLAAGAALGNSIFSLFLPMGWAIILATLVSSVGVEWVSQKGGIQHG